MRQLLLLHEWRSTIIDMCIDNWKARKMSCMISHQILKPECLKKTKKSKNAVPVWNGQSQQPSNQPTWLIVHAALATCLVDWLPVATIAFLGGANYHVADVNIWAQSLWRNAGKMLLCHTKKLNQEQSLKTESEETHRKQDDERTSERESQSMSERQTDRLYFNGPCC